MSSETTIKKLKPTSVADWINTLKFGGYKQCSGRLHEGSEFCCLGVALDIAGTWWHLIEDERGRYYYSHAGSDTYPGQYELEELGELGEFLMQPCDPVGSFDGGTVKDYCIYMNDAEGYDFPMIANEVEILYRKWIAEERAMEHADA